jgi:hypothetical protein
MILHLLVRAQMSHDKSPPFNVRVGKSMVAGRMSSPLNCVADLRFGTANAPSAKREDEEPPWPGYFHLRLIAKVKFSWGRTFC